MRCLVPRPHPRRIRRPRPSRLKNAVCRLESRHRTGRKRDKALKEVDSEKSADSMCESHVLMGKRVVVPRHAKSVSCLSLFRSVRLTEKTPIFMATARHGHEHGRRGSGSRRQHHHGHSSEHKNAPTSPDPFAIGKSPTYLHSYLDQLISNSLALAAFAKHSPKCNKIPWTLLS